MFDTLIRGGTVVTATGQVRADVGLTDGLVAGIGSKYAPSQAKDVVEAGGLLVLPGLIDPHVHFSLPFMGTVTRHDFTSGTVAAAAGGVTTIVDFAFQEKGKPVMDAVRLRQEEAAGSASIDYAFHAIFTDVDDRTSLQLPELIKAGICSWKVFMAYRKLGLMVDDGGLWALLEASNDLPCIGIAHAENGAIIDFLTERLLADGHVTPPFHARSRPALAEAEAVARAARLAGAAGTPFYFFHLSSADAVAEVRAAKAEGWPIYAETCAHYLLLDQEVYERPEGYRWCMSPPLRVQRDRDALWSALASGLINIVSSDDCSFDVASKARGQRSFVEVPQGVPGVEPRLSLLYSEGVHQGRITAERLVALCSTNPARLLGMYPRKGTIAVGSDADLILFDPDSEQTLSQENSHMQAGWHPFEGWRVRGRPVMTIAQGRVIMKDDAFCGREGSGRFVHRSLDPSIRQGVPL